MNSRMSRVPMAAARTYGLRTPKHSSSWMMRSNQPLAWSASCNPPHSPASIGRNGPPALLYYWRLRPSTSSSSSFSSSSKKRKKHEANLKLDKSDDNPFEILNVKRTDSFKAVKKSFLKLAMDHHPDRCSSADGLAEQTRHKEIFMAARKAFEKMMEGPDGLVMLKSESEDYQEDQANMDVWFKHETGYDMPFMDQATMKEVAKMTEEVGGGLDRDGGMWTLAKMVTNAVNSGGDATSILRLEAGGIRDRQIDGLLRRKRKR